MYFDPRELEVLRTLVNEAIAQNESVFEQIEVDKVIVDVEAFSSSTQDTKEIVRTLYSIKEELYKQ